MHNSMHHNPYDDTEEMIIAHMSPSEIKELAQFMPGGLEADPQTRLPSFKKLMGLMNHPSVKNGLIEWEGNRFAGGGEVEGFNNFLRNSGRFGDTMAVHLPRPLADLFDRALSGGQPSINPKTGRREYFLGGFLGGLGKIFSPISNALSPILSPVMNAVKPIASAFAPMAGNALKTMAPIAGAMGGKALGGMASAAGLGPLGNILGNTVGNALGGMASNIGSQMAGGQSPAYAQAGRQAVQETGQNMAPYVSEHVSQMGQNMANRFQNPYLQQMATHMGNFGGELAHNMMNTGATAFGGGTRPNYGQAAANTGANYLSQFQNPFAQAGSQMLGTYGQGTTPQYLPQ